MNRRTNIALFLSAVMSLDPTGALAQAQGYWQSYPGTGNAQLPAGHALTEKHSSRQTPTALSLSSTSGPQLAWAQQYVNPTYPSYSDFKSVVIDRDGNVYAAGVGEESFPRTKVGLLCKYDSKGVLQWTNREAFGGPYCCSYGEGALGLALDSAGNIYVRGWPALAKFSPQGVMQWCIDTCEAINMAVDPAGSVFVTRCVQTSVNSSEIVTVKYSAAGVLQWKARFKLTDASTNYPNDIVLDKSGAIIVTGLGSTLDGSYTGGITVKYSADGIERWRVSHGRGHGGGGGKAAVDTAGSVYISSSNGDGSCFTAKLDSSGITEWSAEAAGYSRGLGVDDSGNVVVAMNANGWVTVKYARDGSQKWLRHLSRSGSDYGPFGCLVDRGGNTCLAGSGDSSQIEIVRLDREGNVCWDVRYPNAGIPFRSEYHQAPIALDSEGKVHVPGAISSLSGLSAKALLLKLDLSGTLQWSATYTGPLVPIDVATGMGMDSIGNTYVCGTSPAINGQYWDLRGITILKYGSNGDLLWCRRLDSLAAVLGVPVMKVAADGSTILSWVTPQDEARSVQLSLTLASFNSNGEQQWSTVYHPPAEVWGLSLPEVLLNPSTDIYAVTGQYGPARSLLARKFSRSGDSIWSVEVEAKTPKSSALDQSGNLYAIAYEDGGTNHSVVKLSNSGHQMWSTLLNRAQEPELEPSALVVDDSGSVFVTGSAFMPNRNKFLTRKFDKNGAYGWVRIFDEGSNNPLKPVSIGVDKNGNVFVTGGWTTVSYDSYGTQRWIVEEQHETGVCTAMIVDENGDVYTIRGDGGFRTSKVSNTGVLLWNASYAAFQADSLTPWAGAWGNPVALVLDQHGHLAISGSFSQQVGWIDSPPYYISSVITTLWYDLVASAKDDRGNLMAGAFVLHQNYPNPFNPSTTIRYGLPSRSHVTLTIFNTLGQHVATLVQSEQDGGYHEVTFDASHLSSGVYLYRLTAGTFVQSRKLVLVR